MGQPRPIIIYFSFFQNINVHNTVASAIRTQINKVEDKSAGRYTTTITVFAKKFLTADSLHWKLSQACQILI